MLRLFALSFFLSFISVLHADEYDKQRAKWKDIIGTSYDTQMRLTPDALHTAMMRRLLRCVPSEVAMS
jgi:hypothetical protein